MQKVLTLIVGLGIGYVVGSGFGERISHWFDVIKLEANGWVSQSSGADDDGRYSILTITEGNAVFVTKKYYSGKERNQRADVNCEGGGTITNENSDRVTSRDDLPPGSIGRAMIESVCGP